MVSVVAVCKLDGSNQPEAFPTPTKPSGPEFWAVQPPARRQQCDAPCSHVVILGLFRKMCCGGLAMTIISTAREQTFR